MSRPVGAGNGVRTPKKSTAPSPSSSVSMENATVSPRASVTRPPIEGPTNCKLAMKPRFPKITPFWICDGATICGTMLWRAGFVKAPAAPTTAASPYTGQITRTSRPHSTTYTIDTAIATP